MNAPRTLYTYGYLGGSEHDLRAWAQAGVLILDVRYKPWSQCPKWRGAALAKLLGDRYQSCRDLGNVNYRGDGPITLRAAEPGYTRLGGLLRSGAVMLLCACPSPRGCHRRVIAEEAVRRGHAQRIVHLNVGDQPASDATEGNTRIGYGAAVRPG